MIYIVEDDENIAELIRASIATIGHDVRIFGSAGAFFAGIKEQTPKLVMLDIMLPEISGFDILKRLKASESAAGIPVIFLSARGSEVDKVTGLELGAEDYITKPFGVLELLARVKAALRRGAEVPKCAAFKDLTLDFKSREVRKNGEIIKLTYREFELLEYLFKNSGTVISRDKLLEAVWGVDFD
ncbi:MAG: response regulator transcription factor, partial [Clostridia bacterium]